MPKCYVCGIPNATNEIMIAESPKDAEFGGYPAVVCDEHYKENDEWG